jgi:L-ribulose-5-phosphate 4-epimerase
VGFERLKEDVYRANMALVEAGLVVLTWGNASGVDREGGVMAIKPSGVGYEDLTAEAIVVLSLESGEVVEGELRPSSDTPTHLLLCREFEPVGAVVHTHSPCATSWAQAAREIPCMGTTHADHFFGPVPLARQLTPAEVEGDYEANVGRIIVERFREGGLSPEEVPAVLVPGHGPFVWGPSPRAAVENAIVLEEVARMALQAMQVNPDAAELPRCLLERHFLRKHGPDAYYGQKQE